jgi:hypothetical protein
MKDFEKMLKIPGTYAWIKVHENKKQQYKEAIYKKASELLPEIENAFKNKIEKDVAYMIATSHEYKTPNIKAALHFTKNYTWEEGTIKTDRLQGINKPIIEDKVKEIAKSIPKQGVKPFVIVNQLDGIRPQTPGKKILIDGHHRLEACKMIGEDEVPVYIGTYTGGAHKSMEELQSKTTAEKKKNIYAFDFDGTIVESKFPEIGNIKKDTVDFMKKCHEKGHRVIIWTCRTGKYLLDMKKFLIKNHIPFDYINNDPENSLKSKKIYADYYIDDKAVNVNDIKSIEKTAKVKSKFQEMKDLQVPLTPEERAEVMKKKAVWHFNGGGPTPAIWKTVNKDSKVEYHSNTHRAWASSPTLKGAINRFHSFIKGTA